MKGYLEQSLEDITVWVGDNVDYIPFEDFSDIDDLEEWLEDHLWTEDSITGNGSGSYTFNSYKAKEYVMNDTDTVITALQEYGTDAKEIGERFINEDWEWLDVTARCWVLNSSIYEYIEQNKDELEKIIEERHVEQE